MTPRFIVCESTNRWTVAMRWGLADSKIWVHQTSDVEYSLAMLAEAAGSVVGIEVAMLGMETTLCRIREIKGRFPTSHVLALADSGQVDRALLLEAGAAHVISSRREVRSAARLVQRCLASAERPAANYRAQVWARMPWGNLAPPLTTVD